jgi:hypothetical protein
MKLVVRHAVRAMLVTPDKEGELSVETLVD